MKRKVLAYLLCFTMMLSIFPTQLFAATTNNSWTTEKQASSTTTPGALTIGETETYRGEGYKTTFKVTNAWQEAFTGEIIIENTGSTAIENWTLEFDGDYDITSIWNAKVTTHLDGHYVIKGEEYTQNIAVGENITLGFNANYEGTVIAPDQIKVLGASRLVEVKNYTTKFNVLSNWNDAFTGEIIVTNTGNSTVEDWYLEFDFDRNIQQFWTADVVSSNDGHYIIKNKGYNANIKAGETITLGFMADPGSGNLEISNCVLKQLTQGDSQEEEIDYEKDTDQDDLSDYYEEELGTDKENLDSDGDGLPDGYEYWELDTDPLLKDTDNNGINDGDEDLDKDGLTNIEEYQLGTDPWSSDSDEDGDEVNKYSTNPLAYDEIDYELDSDSDGIADGIEMRLGTDKDNADTDGDNLPDGYELNIGKNPLKADSNDNGILDGEEDNDKDGLINFEEYQLGTDPSKADTDSDKLNDGEEANHYKTDPLKYDTDDDTIGDGDEIKLGLNPLSTHTNGVADNEYMFEQSVSEEALSYVNEDGNPFTLSIDVKASGNAEDNVVVYTSQNNYALTSNEAILGEVITVDYFEGKIAEGTLSFKMNQAYADKASQTTDEMFAGLKKYWVFTYNEENNMLVPVPTTYDVANDTVKGQMVGTGTYCMMDVETWLLNIGTIEKDEAQAKAIDHSVQTSSIVTQSDYELNGEQTFNVVIKKFMAAPNQTTSSKTVKKADLVFVVDTDATMEKQMDAVKKGIKQTVETLRDTYGIDLNICIIDYKNIDALPESAVIRINGQTVDAVRADQSLYFTQDSSMINTIVEDLTPFGGYEVQVSGTPLAGLGYLTELPFREGVQRFAILITNKGYNASNCHGFKNLNQLFTALQERNISLSVSSMSVPQSGGIADQTVKLYRNWVSKNNGIFVLLRNLDMTSYIDFVATNLIAEKEFTIIQSQSLKQIVNGNAGESDFTKNIALKSPLVKGGKTDTDGDGKTDSEEVKWGNEYTLDEVNIKWTADGYELPLLKDLWGDFSVRYEYDVADIPFAEKIGDIRVLPVLSDPTMIDSDADGLNDLDDTMPFINDFKELWYKMTINEKEFYLGHTGYGINAVQAHVYDTSNGRWEHYGLIDGVWLISDDARIIKNKIEDIEDYFDIENQTITFEHPDEDVVIDLDEVWGTCRKYLEGYDSFIEGVKEEHCEELDTTLGILIGFIDCYFEEEVEIIDAKSTKGISLSKIDAKKSLRKMVEPDLGEMKSFILFLLDEDEEELEEHYTYMNVKVTTDKACIFGFSVVSGASAIVGGAQVAKGGGEIASGVASAPETAGASIVITAKGGIELKKGVEKLDRAWDFGKKAAHSYEQYRLDKETFEDIEGASKSSKVASIKWKGFEKGKLKAHYEKHVLKQNEFGDITQNEYLRLAKEFAAEEGSNFVETEVSNILIKYDSATRRVFIGNAKTREIRSFYIAGEDVADPLQQAIDIAMDKTTN